MPAEGGGAPEPSRSSWTGCYPRSLAERRVARSLDGESPADPEAAARGGLSPPDGLGLFAYNYVTRVELPRAAERLALHTRIVEGSAPAPYAYRVLVPYVAEGAARLLTRGLSAAYPGAVAAAYAGYDLAALSLFLLALLGFLRLWHPEPYALLGAVLCAALLPISLRDHFFQPWSLLEPAIFCLAYVAAYRDDLRLALALTVVAVLNRETGVFVPVVYLLGTFGVDGAEKTRPRLQRAALLVLAAGTVYSLLRLWRGPSPPSLTVADVWAINTDGPRLALALVHWVLFLGAGWVLALRGLRHADPFLRRQLLLVPLYLVPVSIWGVWKEVRLLLPLYPVLVALLLFPVERALERTRPDPTAADGP